MQQHDAAVEFARFRTDHGRLTWIGVYKRSIDAKFGDRANHAGVGAWLQERNLSATGHLVEALSSLTDELEARGSEKITADVDSLVKDFLPQYVTNIPSLPPELSGWAYSGSHFSETALYAASSADPTVWTVISENLAQWSALPGPSPSISRAVILVSAAFSRTSASLSELKMPGCSSMIEYLPTALKSMTDEATLVQRKAASAISTAERLSAELERERSASSDLRSRIQTLEQEVADSDLLRRLAGIDRTVQAISGQVSRIETDVKNLTRTSVRRDQNALIRDGYDTNPYGRTVEGSNRHIRAANAEVGSGGLGDWLGQYWWFLALMVAAAGVVGVVGFLFLRSIGIPSP